MRYLRLWAVLLGWSFRRAPVLTASVLGLNLANTAAIVGSALAVRTAVSGAAGHSMATALVGALAAVLCFAGLTVLSDIRDNLQAVLVDKVGITEVLAGIQKDLAGIQGLEPLEDPLVLDKISVVLRSGGALVAGMWAAVAALFGVVQLAASLSLLAAVNPWLPAFLLFAAAPLWADHLAQVRIVAGEEATAESFRVQRHLFETLTSADSAKEIRVAGVAGQLLERTADVWDEVTRSRAEAQFGAAIRRMLGWAVFTVGWLAALGLVASPGRHLSAGDLVMSMTIVSTLRQSLQAAVSNTMHAAGARRIVEPYLWLREFTRTATPSQTRLAPPDRLEHGITLRTVGYRYPGTGVPALEEVSAHLPAGSVVAIVGEHGSGKSTLAKLLCGFYQPDTGSVLIDGVPLADLDLERWRSRLSAAFQDFGRFETVFAEGVGIGDLPHVADREHVEAAIAAADAEAFAARLQDGLDTQLGRGLGGVDLSEGQWQKTALARASMREEPLLLVLDEPTASLDAPSEHEIFVGYLARARRAAERAGTVTVIVSHRFSTVADADLILVLHEGRLVEAGSHQALTGLGPEGRYAELYGLQATAYTAERRGD